MLTDGAARSLRHLDRCGVPDSLGLALPKVSPGKAVRRTMVPRIRDCFLGVLLGAMPVIPRALNGHLPNLLLRLFGALNISFLSTHRALGIVRHLSSVLQKHI